MATKKNRKKTYKLMTFQIVVGEDGIGKREYVAVDTGLTWSEAQEQRREDRSLIIVPEARVYKRRASKKKTMGQTDEVAVS